MRKVSTGAVLTLALLAAGLLVRVALAWRRGGFVFPDEAWYYDLGRSLLEHGTYRLSDEGTTRFAICVAPGLPLLLATVGLVIPLTPIGALLVNAVAGWLTVVLFVALARRWTGGWAAAAWMAVAGFHPVWVYLNTTNYPQNAQGLALALLAWAVGRRWQRAERGVGPLAVMGEGACLGWGALLVPMHLVTAPIWLLTWPLRPRMRRHRAARLGAAGAAVVIAPWTLRNAIVERDFVPISAGGGQQLFTGFNADANMNTSVADISKAHWPPGMADELAAARTGREFEAAHTRAAKQWIRENPRRAAKLWVLKGFNFFRWDTGRLTSRTGTGAAVMWLQRLATVAAYGALALAFLRLRGPDRRWPRLALGLLFIMALAHAFFVSRYRYRLPFEPLLLFCGALAMARRREEPETGC